MKKKKPGKLDSKKRIKPDPTKRLRPYRVYREDIMGRDANGNPKIEYSIFTSHYRVNCKRLHGAAVAK